MDFTDDGNEEGLVSTLRRSVGSAFPCDEGIPRRRVDPTNRLDVLQRTWVTLEHIGEKEENPESGIAL